MLFRAWYNDLFTFLNKANKQEILTQVFACLLTTQSYLHSFITVPYYNSETEIVLLETKPDVTEQDLSCNKNGVFYK